MSDKTYAVILAGGRGRRLHPFTTTIPKPLFPLGEKPILQIIIEQLKESDISDFIISLGYLGGLIEAYFGDGKNTDCRIQYVRETNPLGTAGPISILPPMKNDYILMNGDVLSTINFKEAIQFHKKNKCTMTVCTYQKVTKSSLGILEIDSNNSITNYLEKPENKYIVSSGIYVLSPEVNKYLGENEKIDLPELVMRLIKEKETVKAFPISGDWFDIGTPDDLNKALDYYEKKK